jgi:hypothetical protein
MNFETEFDNTQLNCLQFALTFAKSHPRIEIARASLDDQLNGVLKIYYG